MSTEITRELQQLVETILQNGRYDDENEVLSEALQLLQRRDELRCEIQTGLAELDQGDRIDSETLFEELRARAAEHAREN